MVYYLYHLDYLSVKLDSSDNALLVDEQQELLRKDVIDRLAETPLPRMGFEDKGSSPSELC